MANAMLTALMCWSGVVSCSPGEQAVDRTADVTVAGHFFSGDETKGQVLKLSQQLSEQDNEIAVLQQTVEIWQKRAVTFSLESEANEEQLCSALNRANAEINRLKRDLYDSQRANGGRPEATISPMPFQSR